MKLPVNLIAVRKTDRSKFDIFLWWELRRFLFNGLLILFILLSLKIIGSNPLTMEMGDGEYFLLIGMVLLSILLNVIYTFGWLIEIFRKERSLTFAPNFFRNLTLLSFSFYCFYAGSIYLLLKYF